MTGQILRDFCVLPRDLLKRAMGDEACRGFKKIFFLNIFCMQILCASGFMEQFSLENPPSLEESLQSILELDCQKVDYLRGFVSNVQFKNDSAVTECNKEQRLLQSIVDDDLSTYKEMVENGELSKYFLFYSTYAPRLEISPLVAAVVFDAQNIFAFMLSDSESAQNNYLRPWIDRPIFDGYTSLGAFKLDDRIYNVNGVSVLDLSAMYHRYDMFWALLHSQASYGAPRNLQTNGIITFGDGSVLELMLYFDEKFLDKVGVESILHSVAREGNVSLVEYLITHKAVNIDTLKAGETALDVALNGKNFQRKPQIEVVHKLIELGAKISEANMHRMQKLGIKSVNNP